MLSLFSVIKLYGLDLCVTWFEDDVGNYIFFLLSLLFLLISIWAVLYKVFIAFDDNFYLT